MAVYFLCFISYRQHSPNLRKTDRRVEHEDSYIQAPAEEIFDTEDSYFDDSRDNNRRYHQVTSRHMTTISMSHDCS